MLLGLIADIHADLERFQCALDVLTRQGATQIVCAGDVVEKGMDGNAVVQTLQTRRIPCVMGNHDRDVMGNQRWWLEHGDMDHPVVRSRLLTPDSLAYLTRLPMTLAALWGGKRLLLTHGTPWSVDEYLHPNSPAELFERVAREAQADVVILGHTHSPMRAWVGGVWIVNPGSVAGSHPRDSHTCAVLTLPDGAFQVLELDTGQPVPAPDIRIQ